MNQIVIKIESGIVADIYFTEPVNVLIVDHDVIEGGESFEDRMKKAVFTFVPERRIRQDEIDKLVMSLVLECSRPVDRRSGQRLVNVEAA